MAMDAVTITLICGSALALAYPLGMWALDKLAQPWRLELADTANRLLNDDGVDREIRNVVAAHIRLAFSPWTMVTWIFVAPWAFFLFVRKDTAYARITSILCSQGKNIHRDLKNVSISHFISAAAANPLAGIVVTIEMAIFMGVLRLVGNTASISDQFTNTVFAMEDHMARQ